MDGSAISVYLLLMESRSTMKVLMGLLNSEIILEVDDLDDVCVSEEKRGDVAGFRIYLKQQNFK
jgi:hypothetical protein